jgi:hypothetical protein
MPVSKKIVMRKPELLHQDVDSARRYYDQTTDDVPEGRWMRLLELEVQFAQLVALDKIAKALEGYGGGLPPKDFGGTITSNYE